MPKDVPVVKPIPVPASFKHPPPEFDVLPTHEFTMGLIAPKGAGKTTVICNLLHFYKNYFHTILVFSPTIDSDEKWDWVKTQKLLTRNVKLEKFLKDLEAKRKKDNGIVDRPQVGGKAIDHDEQWSPYIDEECFFQDYNEDRFSGIMEEQMLMVRLLKKHKQSKHLANRILIVFDDLVGSALFAGTKGSYFKGVNTRHRHYSASFLMVSQGYKEVPRTIRTNWTCLIIFEIGSDKEVECIMEEYGMSLSKDQWLETYRYCTGEDHSFLYINLQKPKRLRMMKNFEQVLFHEDERLDLK